MDAWDLSVKWLFPNLCQVILKMDLLSLIAKELVNSKVILNEDLMGSEWKYVRPGPQFVEKLWSKGIIWRGR